MRFIIPEHNQSLILEMKSKELIVKRKHYRFLEKCYFLLYRKHFGIQISNRRKHFTNAFISYKKIQKDFEITLDWYLKNPMKEYVKIDLLDFYERCILLLEIYPYYDSSSIRSDLLFLLLYKTKHLSIQSLKKYINLATKEVPERKFFEKFIFENLIHYNHTEEIDHLFLIKDEHYLKFLLNNYSIKYISYKKKLKHPLKEYRFEYF